MNNPPNGWSVCRLENIADDISYGYTAKSDSFSGDARMLRITDIQDGRVAWGKVPFCQIGAGELKKYSLQNQDLVFARTGATVGKSYLVCNVPENVVFASYLIRVRLKDSGLSRYLSHFFGSYLYWGQISDFSAGIGQPNVNGSKLKNLVVPIAPEKEQQRIADKLDTVLTRVDACRDRLARVAPLLKRFRQSVLAAATSGRLTEDWRNDSALWEVDIRLSSVGVVSGGLTKNSKRDSYALNRPYLRVANVHANELRLDDVSTIGLSEQEFEKTRLRSGDLLIVEGNGSLDQIGRVALWGNEIEDCSHQNHLIRWRAGSRILPKYALLFLLSPAGREQIVKVASSTTGLHTLSVSKIGALTFSLPGLAEQTEIVRRVETLFAFADRLEARLKAAQTAADRLTPALLAKAFRGELVPQDPNDEPAAELLKRLAASRDAAPKAKRGRRSATADTTP